MNSLFRVLNSAQWKKKKIKVPKITSEMWATAPRKVSDCIWKVKADFIRFSKSQQTLPPRGRMPAPAAWEKSARQDTEPGGTEWNRAELCLWLHHPSLHRVLHKLFRSQCHTWMAAAKDRYNVCKVSVPKSVCSEGPQQKLVITRKRGDHHEKILLTTTDH